MSKSRKIANSSRMHNFKNVAVVLPSFNEHENIPLLINSITAELPGAHIIIIDDSSEKIYAKIKKKLIQTPEIACIHRKKKSGRGSAVLEGFKLGLQKKNLEYFFEMDADLSHDPKDFHGFISKILQTHADVVIGSRYIKHSQIIDWPFHRYIASKMANKVIHALLGLRLTDYTNGFRLYNKKAATFLITAHLREKGFIMLSESVYALHRNGFYISEIPVHFRNRKYGKSSAGMKEAFMTLVGILRIRFIQQ